MSDLITVPTFNFRQGKVGDSNWERPIEVSFYNGSISLTQEGEFNEDECVQIHPDHVRKLFKAIIKNIPEAAEWLNRK